ncbi:hypothetical protein IQ225_16570, partial [Synechocystis salina LEGE 06155]|nr:hypothetical protein [Synechocystis salina LEGE 06155]
MVDGLNSTSALSMESPILGEGLDYVPMLEPHIVEEYCHWLRVHRLWGQLSELALQDLARSLHFLKVDAETPIYRINQPPIGLYLLKTGDVEISRQSDLNKALIR